MAIKALDVAAQIERARQGDFGPDSGGMANRPWTATCSWHGSNASPRQPATTACCAASRDGLESIRRLGSAENLEERLKHLADLDAERAHASFGLLRLIVWAIPILGFLGTVIGITMAIASLKPSALEESMVEVTAGLGVAFDTTALALALSIILMFIQFYVDRAEGGLLAAVDARVQAELIGRFREVSADPDTQVAAMRRMSQTMIQSMEETVRRQAELWRSAAEQNQQHWGEVQSTLVRAAENLAAVQHAAGAEGGGPHPGDRRRLVRGRPRGDAQPQSRRAWPGQSTSRTP